MPVKFDPSQTNQCQSTEAVKIGDSELSLIVVSPTLDEVRQRRNLQAMATLEKDVVREAEIYTRQDEFSIKSVIKGWKGVEDQNGEEVEYSFENLLKLCEQLPGLLSEVFRFVNLAFEPMTEDAAKNSDGRQADSSQAEPAPQEKAESTKKQ